MPMSSADLPGAEKPDVTIKSDTRGAKKAAAALKKPAEKTGLADAAVSSDPYVQKLMWDRGFGADPVKIDAELRKLGFDL